VLEFSPRWSDIAWTGAASGKIETIMQAPPADKSAPSWAFDALVMVLGLGLAALAVLRFVAQAPPTADWLLALAVGAPLIVLTAWFPLVVSGRGLGIEVGFEAAVLITLLLVVGPTISLAVWVAGQAISTLSGRRRPDVRLFNFGLATIDGALAVAVIDGSGQIGRTAPAELAWVCLGCVVYFATDYFLTAVSTALEDDCPLLSELRHRDALLAVVVFLGVDSLGYLAALVMRALPVWSGLLLAGPLATILVASRALSRGGEHRRRLTALVAASSAVQGAASSRQLITVLHEQARRVVGRRDMVWRGSPPAKREIGVELPDGLLGPDGARWLVAPGADRARSTAEQDQRTLDALVGVARETTARLRLVDRLAEQARRDSLTGLPNRLMLTERLEQLMGHRGRRRVAVMYLDLDGFKSVNDRFGHAGGDDLLRRIADRLTTLAEPEDLVARLGGDEFAVLLVGARTQDVQRICEQVLTAVRVPVPLGGHSVVVGASIGVCLAGEEDDTAELMRNADMAMYRAKARGKNEYVVYERSLGDDRIRRLELVEALRSGIETELVVHYQPLVDLVTEQIIGAEALVRWQHQGRLVPPDQFIPAAEDSGLIVPLGNWVLRQVTRDAPQLIRAAGGPIDIAVNMSAHQLRDVDFPIRVQAATTELGDSRLVLEMTETVLVQDDAGTARALHRLTAAGARLAIDDFGVGYSSIGYLQHLPVSVVKIDRSFVREIATGARGQALINAILMMGSALGLDVIAEGIERPDQLGLLTAAGCRQGQGFLFARPQALPDFLELIRSGLPVAVSEHP
jgi:diguanylate cyclase (GGDEF)-like protein